MTGSILPTKKGGHECWMLSLLLFFYFIKIAAVLLCAGSATMRLPSRLVYLPPNKTESSMSLFDSMIECLNTILEYI